MTIQFGIFRPIFCRKAYIIQNTVLPSAMHLY
nr:MAG TPA: hypothetical protein [Caudoviricetes sp.]